MTEISDAKLIDALAAAAVEAGEAILVVRRGGVSVEKKADASPVTEADRAAERVIAARLAEVVPSIPMIGEEAAYDGNIPDIGREFFLVDPLDGTREFVKGGSDFTVNIGLVRDGLPVLGVIFVPVTGDLYAGVMGEGAWRADVKQGVIGPRRPMRVRPPPEGPVDVVASRSHRNRETDDYIARFDVRRLVPAGSSVKFCVLAAGEADLYPRMGPTMQWDTAAGEAILRAAGGSVVAADGSPLFYGRGAGAGQEAFRNPSFIATGGMNPIPTTSVGKNEF
jgi:3'(2'), 5'-bisphosphate nucleotidase